MPITMLINLKGGVAKTTSAVAIAECLATEGHRTLLIDADHQSMSSLLLIGDKRLRAADNAKGTLHDMLAALLEPDVDGVEFSKYVVHKASNIGEGMPNLSVLPCSFRIDDFITNMLKAQKRLGDMEAYQATMARGRNKFRRWLETYYDYVVIDCPPSLAIQVKFLLPVADNFIVPCIPDWLSVRGSLHLIEQLRVKGYKTPPLGTLWSLYKAATKTHTEYMAAKQSGEPKLAALPEPFRTRIPSAAAITKGSEAGANYRSFTAKYTSEFAGLFKELVAEIIERCDAQAKQAAASTVETVPAIAPTRVPAVRKAK